MKTITVFEHQLLKISDNFTDDHRRELELFMGNKDEEIFPFYTLIHKGIKFRHFVGVLCVNDLTIEVLPKTDQDGFDSYDEKKLYWQEKLFNMLSAVYNLDVKYPSDANQKTNNTNPILDIFIKRFLDEVDSLLNRGLVKCYHKSEGNRSSLKGRLVLREQLRRNFIHQERFYVRYTNYDFEHVMNCLIRQALEIATTVTHSISLRGRAVSTLFNFPEVKTIPYSSQLVDDLVYDRKTEDYQMAIKLAKLLLLHSVPCRVGNGDRILALMFDMNKLWEEYVCVSLRRNMPGYEVRGQESKSFWSNYKASPKKVRPDIVLRKDDRVVAILDTKWKCPRDTPSDGDLHQMFVYSHLFDSDSLSDHIKVGLVYPSTVGQSTVQAYFLDKGGNPSSRCDMLYLPPKLETKEYQSIRGWINQKA